MNLETTPTTTKKYEIRQLSDAGDVLSAQAVDASSGEAAAKQLKQVVDGAGKIEVCLDGISVSEMGVSYWRKRVRR
ncbi:hypothetical protein [Novipirellula artificiosorum]|uniref:Uncharacterized protein n=1 Tax=Novipirellula artificiosorum TaxID=2528016 RepID=A0A5C6DQK4_9BACT|nr:hypothetical protein [Novipirellula artificiosorum]TWU38505.1 hypothetical protein Poly41_29810 [Novipirellula artificiosorum]